MDKISCTLLVFIFVMLHRMADKEESKIWRILFFIMQIIIALLLFGILH